MAFTYLGLNIVVIIVVLLGFARYIQKPNRAVYIMAVALILLTLIFDNLIIAAGIVGYDSTKLLGLYIGIAPFEDFFYTILAAILVPTLWNMFSLKNAPKKEPHA